MSRLIPFTRFDSIERADFARIAGLVSREPASAELRTLLNSVSSNDPMAPERVRRLAAVLADLRESIAERALPAYWLTVGITAGPDSSEDASASALASDQRAWLPRIDDLLRIVGEAVDRLDDAELAEPLVY